MNAIWRFYLGSGQTTIHAPGDWTPLHVDEQGNGIILWALVEPEKPMTNKTFLAVQTGEPFDASGLKYIGTVTDQDGWMVFHVFQMVED